MKTYEEHATEFSTGKEYTRAEVEQILISFKRYSDTIANLIEQSERIFMISGEVCGFEAASLCGHAAKPADLEPVV